MSPPPPHALLTDPVILTGIGTDAVNSFEDLSGVSSTKRSSTTATPTTTTTTTAAAAVEYENPYDALLDACGGDPAKIEAAYETHRVARNANQRARLLAPDFAGITVDGILRELDFARASPRVPRDAFAAAREEAEIDPRHCLVFWGRPTAAVMALVAGVQAQLRELAPDLWLMPQDCLHLTVLELIHSTTQTHLAALLDQVRPHAKRIVEHVRTHRARLVRPLLSFDAAALAISFVPAAGDGPPNSNSNSNSNSNEGEGDREGDREADADRYTYHHLRRDFYRMSRDAGVGVTSRYNVPSAHITIARFVDARDLDGDGDAPGEGQGQGQGQGQATRSEKIRRWVRKIDEINRSLPDWDGEWVVGSERGVELRAGRVWYGGGYTVEAGEPF